MRAFVLEAAQQGLFNLTVGQKWEVPSFQFFMGDLGNSFPGANRYKSDDAFTADCSPVDPTKIAVSVFSDREIYAEFQESCTAKYSGTELFRVEMTLVFTVELVFCD